MAASESFALPLLSPVDVVVVGATTAAVAAALELRARGRSVLAVSDHSYFGVESAGTLGLWPALDGADREPLLGVLAAARENGLIRPGAIKRAWEAELLRAGVRFLYLVRPVAWLRAAGDRPAGLVLAHRTAWMAVRCGAVVDATPGGLVARLAGVAAPQRRSPPLQLTWTVFAERRPEVGGAAMEEIGTPVSVPGHEGAMTVQGYRLQLARPATAELNLRHALRATMGDRAIRLTADHPVDVPAEVFSLRRGLAARVDELAAEDCEARPGLWLAGAALPLTVEAALALHEPAAQIALGRKVGAWAATAPAGPGDATLLSATTGGSAGGPYRALPAFVRAAAGTLEVSVSGFPLLGRCDVAVAGGGTGGAPAGVAAARAGAHTVIFEAQAGLGGVGTLGLIASYYFGNKVGYTSEIDRLVDELDPDRKRPGRWNPEVKLAAIHRLVHAAGAEAWLGSYAVGVRRDGDRVTGLLVSTPAGVGLVETGCVVDATGSADVAAAAGAPCRVVGRGHAAVQGAGLSARSPGRDYANSDHTFIDDNDPEGVTHAFVNARAKFAHEFDTSPLVDTRERRQIEGDLELSPLDFLAGRTFPDTLFTARSNFDTHGFTVHPVFMVQPPDKKPLEAHVPLRVMLPRGLDGVLVTGLGMSAHRDAIPVIRMQADVQNQGYGAGLAAAESARGLVPLRALDVKALQRRLVAAGVLGEEVPGQGDSFPLGEAELRAAVEAGPDSVHHAAVLFAHAEQARPWLLAQLDDPVKGDGAAFVLGLLGEPAAAPRLRAMVEAAPWDEGWNYRGMGQFGFSTSPLDGRIIALGRTRDPAAVPVLAEKIRALGDEPAFSHCRAVAIAACCLRAPELATPLHELLQRPGMQGHAQIDTAEVVAQANDDRNETAARNAALRELYLARALLACGDRDGLGRRTLERYARDLRGVFARHARAVLAEGEPEDVREIA